MEPFGAPKNMHEAPMSSSAFAVTKLGWVVGHSWSILPRQHVRSHVKQCSAPEADDRETVSQKTSQPHVGPFNPELEVC